MTPQLPASTALASETLLRAMFDDSPLALAVLTGEGEVHAVNATFREQFNRGIPGTFVWTLADDADAAHAWWQTRPDAPLMIAGWAFSARPLGEAFVLLEASPPRHPLDDPTFLRLADTLPVIVWLTDGQGTSRFLNRHWYEFTGAEASPEAWWAVLHPDDRAATETAWAEAKRTGEPFVMEYRFRRRDGAFVWHLVHALPQHHPDGSLWGWMGLCTSLEPLARDDASRQLLDDLAGERAARQKLADTLDARVQARTDHLEAQNQALVSRNRDLHDFAYVASHDLQEPLRKILSYADLLRLDFGDALPEEAQGYVDRMQNAATRMSRLVRDLLVYSRIVTNPHPPEPVPLNGIVEDVRSDLAMALHESGGRLEVEALPTVVADPTQMRQLLQNLILNALKYRREGVPPVVQVRGHVEPTGDAAPQRVVLTVQDNGRGFSDADAERIFAPFQRLVGREIEGTGFGLAIVRRIAERHGGTVAATGVPGEGATFTVTLPFRVEL